MELNLFVIKRNSSKEPFDKEKIRRVVTAAGLNDSDADSLVNEVVKWIASLNREEVTTLEIRDKVKSELLKRDENAHNLFVWYESTKDKH